MPIPEPLFRVVLFYLRAGWIERGMRQDVLRGSTPFPVFSSWMHDRHTCGCEELTHDDPVTSVCTLECGHVLHQQCMTPGFSSCTVMCTRCAKEEVMTPRYHELKNTTFPFHFLGPGATTVTIDNGLLKFAATDESFTAFQSLEGEFEFDTFPATIGALIDCPREVMDAARQRSIQRGLRHPSLRHRQPCATDWEDAFQYGLILLQLRVDAPLKAACNMCTFGPFNMLQCDPVRGSTKPTTIIYFYLEDRCIYI